jgi:hypothetical protein
MAERYATLERVSPGEPMVTSLARIGHPLRISSRTKPKGFIRAAEGLGTRETSPGSG